jgi:hypothetical protein
MSKTTALVPTANRVVDFYGDPIRGLIVLADGQPTVYVPLRPLCDYLGLDWSAQYRRLHRDAVLREVLQAVAITATASHADEHEMVCLPLEFLPGWLFTINTARVKPELQEKITQYRRECFTVLWRAFQAESLTMVGPAPPTHDEPSREMATASATTILTQLRDQALTQAALAEQQIALEMRVGTHDDRFRQAALVIRDMQRRVGALEERIQPSQLITEEEASEVAIQVKALAEILTTHDPSKNHYQSIFGELNRRFRVASYRRLSRAQLADVVQFLDDWRTRAAV